MREINEITGIIVSEAYRLHSGLGPGLLESVYESVLARRLGERGLAVERQKPVSFEFDGLYFDDGFKVDLLIENKVVIELKSVEKLVPVHAKQLLTYLRLLNVPIGLLINFGAENLREGIRRVVNTRAPDARAILGPREPR